MNSQKILIDTDPGDDVDDVLAIAFALLRPELDVRGITTVTGDTVKRAHIISKLLTVLGRTDVEIAAGMQLPLRTFDRAGRAHWMEQAGYRLNHYPWVLTDPEVPLPEINDDAIALMRGSSGKIPGRSD
jgi:purine nucleosidase/pyrimidine-specific ribonucleoside hydrolase